MTPAGADQHSPTILLETQPNDQRVLSELRADPTIEFLDNWPAQRAELAGLRPAPHPEVISEPKHWAYYPWRRAAVSILGPRGFRAVRLDRNRNLITAAEQQRLSRLRVGVIGLSVGHAIAHTLAQEGLCGQLRLTDFDELELSNLNRVPATVFDLGLNKAKLAARRIAELDPYLPVEVFDRGITPESIDRFLDGLDIVVEVCDSLDAKVLIRQEARARRIPVLMATGDRGTLDVERFDLEPHRQVLHGLLGDIDFAELSGLSSEDKVPYALRMMEGAHLSPRMAASLVEVGTSLSTWPQLVPDIVQGAALVAEAVRRIGLGEELASGRVRADIAQDLNAITEPPLHRAPSERTPAEPTEPAPQDAVGRVIAAAVRAPSGGNMQPWQISVRDDAVTIALAPEYTSTMDVSYRASAVAVGAAAFNARVAAAAGNILGPLTFEAGDERTPLRAVLRLANGSDPELAGLYDAMLARQTNRRRGKRVSLPDGLSDDAVAALHAAARREGARLHLLTAPAVVADVANILAESDRIRYLTPHLHAEMISEVRWPGDPNQDDGIDVNSLELKPADLMKLDVLRRGDVMAHLAAWDAGAALGTDTRERVQAGGCVAVISVSGQALTDYARAGSAVEAVWVLAQQAGLAVQPISPVFLYAHDRADLEKLSAPYASALHELQRRFRNVIAASAGESPALVLRFASAPATSVRSRRRPAGTSTLMA